MKKKSFILFILTLFMAFVLTGSVNAAEGYDRQLTCTYKKGITLTALFAGTSEVKYIITQKGNSIYAELYYGGEKKDDIGSLSTPDDSWSCPKKIYATVNEKRFGSDTNNGTLVSASFVTTYKLVGSEVVTSDGETEDLCETVVDKSVTDMLDSILKVIQYVGPLLAIGFSILDLIKSFASGKQEDLTKAIQKMIKRLILAIILFVIPTIVNAILSLFNIGNGCV